MCDGGLMRVSRQAGAKRDTLNICIKPQVRGLIDRAAFEVSPKAYAEFLARLDAPPQPNDRLRRSLQTPAPWE